MSAEEKEKQNLGNQIREAEVKNILKKLREGKTLNARESRIAYDYAEEKSGKRMAEMSPSVDVNTLANLFNLTTVWVQKLAKEGVITKTERGRYDLWPSIRGYVKHLQERRVNQWDNGEQKDDWNAERTRLTRAKADMAEMQAAILKGTVHEARAVEAVWTDHLMACRAKLLAMPKKLAPRVHGTEKLTAIEAEIEAAIVEALNELAAYDPNIVTDRYVSTHREELDASTEVEGEPVG
jgi:phage terminase Nu1 subunit (DNA packaging protein)